MNRMVVWLACAVCTGALAWAGCGDEPKKSEDDGGAAGSAGSSPTSTQSSAQQSGSSTANSSSGAGATGPGCDAPATPPSDGACITLTTGAGVGGGGGGGGGTVGVGGGGGGPDPSAINCNPVTNDPCATGDACDAAMGGGFLCFPPPNNATICAACDFNAMNFCMGGLACADATMPAAMGKCVHYCCDDADCGTGTCTKTGAGGPMFAADPDLGLCLVP